MDKNVELLEAEMSIISRNLQKSKQIKKFENNPEIIERQELRYKRKELKSTNPKYRETYDQFYRDHQLMLKLFIFLGVMPLQTSPGNITFNWRSKQMLYAVCFYVFTSALVARVGYERLQILQTTEEFDEYIYAIIFVLFLIPHFYTPFVGWMVAKHVALYKSMWGPFQVRFYRVTGNTLIFPTLSFLIIIFFIGCVLLSVIFLYLLSSLLDGFLLWHTTAYFHIITMINMNAALFYINSKAITDSAKSLSEYFEKDMKIECNTQVVSQYRVLWLNLSEILQALGNAYARTYSTYILFMAINITVGAYGALSGILENGISFKVLGLIVLTVYCTVLLLIVCDCAEDATSIVASGVQNVLLSLNLRRVNAQTRREIDFFISAIELNPPVVNMHGYGFINRALLTSLFSQIATYLIVLLQLKLSLVSEQNMRAQQKMHMI